MSFATIEQPDAKETLNEVAELDPTQRYLRVRFAWLIGVLVAMVLGMAVLSTGGRVLMTLIDGESYGAVRELAFRLDMDRENTLPAWFSSLLLFSCAAVAAVIWQIRRQANGRFLWHWAFLALVFAYLSLDESASIHEILIVPLRRRMGLGGILYFAWVVPGAVLLSGFLIAYLGFWWKLPRPVRGRVAWAATLYIGGALGLELIGGALAETYGLHATSYTIVMTMEESMEMLGLIVFLSALLELVRQEAPRLQLIWATPNSAPQPKS